MQRTCNHFFYALSQQTSLDISPYEVRTTSHEWQQAALLYMCHNNMPSLVVGDTIAAVHCADPDHDHGFRIPTYNMPSSLCAQHAPVSKPSLNFSTFLTMSKVDWSPWSCPCPLAPWTVAAILTRRRLQTLPVVTSVGLVAVVMFINKLQLLTADGYVQTVSFPCNCSDVTVLLRSIC